MGAKTVGGVCVCKTQGPLSRLFNPRVSRTLTKESTACGPITYYSCKCLDCEREWEEEL